MTTENQENLTAAEQGDSVSDSGANQNASADARNAASVYPGSNNGGGSENGKSVLAKKDETIAQLQQQISRNALHTQINQLESTAANESNADIEAVSDGEMTAENARSRAETRRAASREGREYLENRGELDARVNTQIVNNALIARQGFANDFAKEFGVDADVLMDDQTIQDPAEMRFKARELSLDQRDADVPGTEWFDSGQSRAASLKVNEMSAIEKVRAGLS
jgi:hypothetical protein